MNSLKKLEEKLDTLQVTDEEYEIQKIVNEIQKIVKEPEFQEYLDSLMETAIAKCHLSQMYENPGMENGMCAGLRTMGGTGEPCAICKECKLNYLYEETHR